MAHTLLLDGLAPSDVRLHGLCLQSITTVSLGEGATARLLIPRLGLRVRLPVQGFTTLVARLT